MDFESVARTDATHAARASKNSEGNAEGGEVPVRCPVCGLPVSKWLFVKDVAMVLNASERTVRYWLAIGRLRGFRIGRCWRVLHSDVDCLVKEAEEAA
jgi:excisionase family DNA binding protein